MTNSNIHKSNNSSHGGAAQQNISGAPVLRQGQSNGIMANPATGMSMFGNQQIQMLQLLAHAQAQAQAQAQYQAQTQVQNLAGNLNGNINIGQSQLPSADNSLHQQQGHGCSMGFRNSVDQDRPESGAQRNQSISVSNTVFLIYKFLVVCWYEHVSLKLLDNCTAVFSIVFL